MAELETAQQWSRLDSEIEQSEGGGVYLGGHALALIEARDKAVALRALDELEARIGEQFKRVDPAWRQLLPILLREARAKYQETAATLTDLQGLDPYE